MEMDPYATATPQTWRRPSAKQRRAEMARRKAELLAEAQGGAAAWLTHCDVWGQVEQTSSAFAEILRHFSAPSADSSEHRPLLVAVRLARAAEVSRAWRSTANSDVVWHRGAKLALGQRFPLVAAMKARPECMASWKQLCVRYIVAAAGCEDVLPQIRPVRSRSIRGGYLVGLTVEQQRREFPSAREPTVLLSTLVDVSPPHCSRDSADFDRPRRDRLAFADCPLESAPVFAWSDLNDHDWLNERSTAAQPRDQIAMASLRVKVMLMRKRDGKLCPLATTCFVATDDAASRSNRTKAESGGVRTRLRCAGPFVLPSMLEGHQHLGDKPEPWIGALDATMQVKLLPGEFCTCASAEFDLEDDVNRPMDIMCRCGCEPCWSVEGVEVFLNRDPNDHRHELSLELLEVEASSSRPTVFAVDDVLRVLESPGAVHCWI